MIYLDNSATTKPYAEVSDVVREMMNEYFGNPSSIHKLGMEAEGMLSRARELAASYIGAEPKEIVFTSGGTESNNSAIKGVAFQYRKRGMHLITSEVEHASVIESMKQLEEFGFDITFLPVNEKGMVSLSDVKKAIRDDTILVSLMLVNNEVGTVQPIHEIGKWLSNHPKVLFHVDAVQGFGKIPFTVKELKVDLMSLSSHKFHGPKGVGLLYVRNGVKLMPLMSGGEQEAGLRSGTENLPSIVGMVKAMRKTVESQKEMINRLSGYKQTMINQLKEWDGVWLNTPDTNSAPHIINFSVPGIKAEVLVHALAEEGIFVSTRSACSSKELKPSRVILAMTGDMEKASSAIRISLGAFNTQEEIELALSILKKNITNLQKIMRV
ncbi:cysteine desulfurase [Microaerobacter geothermalis]|uniref:cysteine desulfurase family protein n=1 Tax=Microaerobacter geothermalis TaxID=674972 RepID=UPI001F46EC95|nr:cysteine desulfurase family protein [Microaerobacter geothermalis]MCF6094997.1 cysteine desulfurase [Microaerobacter geothermalis]